MHFNQLLEIEGIDPPATLVMRHRPTERKLRAAFARIAQEQPDLFNTYQRVLSV